MGPQRAYCLCALAGSGAGSRRGHRSRASLYSPDARKCDRSPVVFFIRRGGSVDGCDDRVRDTHFGKWGSSTGDRCRMGVKPSAGGAAAPHALVGMLDDVGGLGSSTVDLLQRARQGDPCAANALFQRLVPALRRWARGRLPANARELCDTEDLVQDTLAGVLRHLTEFEARHQGSLLAYLR